MSEYIFKPRCTDDFELDERDKTNPVDWYGTLHGKIVRCRDCEHMRELHPLNPITGVPAGITIYRCSYFWTGDELPDVEPDGFCAWASRREGAES